MRLTRRGLLGALGALWLLDGCLQLQPHMFTQAFFGATFETANVSLPSWLTGVEVHLDTWTGAHPLPWDLGIAGTQLAIGLALLAGRWTRTALAVSVVWAAAVWVFGEGLGAMSLSGTNAMTGAPGAALLYAAVAVVLWPAGTDDRPAAADSGLAGPWGARALWAVFWMGTAALWLEYQSHMAQGPGGALSGIGNGEPGWVSSVNHQLGQAVGDHGPALAALLGALQVIAGLGVLMPAGRRVALVVGGALAVFYGLFGQDLGGLFTGAANDPGTGPVLVVWALALWPRLRSAHDPGVTEGVPAGLRPHRQPVG